MARLDIAGEEMAGLASAQMDGRAFYELGVMYAAGRSVELDRVTAHKWLNIAAVRGCRDAIPLRSELASEMSSAEIAEAQRAARLWLSLH
jgi:TPR repeat protein